MKPDDVLSEFKKAGALLEGHFLLSSGLHSPNYMQCALLLARPDVSERLGRALADLFPTRPDLVVSPAMGGLIIGQEVARAYGTRHYFTERDAGTMTLRRGFSIKPGEKVVVVEDVVTTGKSSQEVIDALAARGGETLAVLSVVDRSGGHTALKVPRFSLLKLAIPSHQPSDCPLCKQGLPAIKPGSRPQPK